MSCACMRLTRARYVCVCHMPHPGNNSLSGTIPTNIVENSQMLALELHNNTALEGTWPTTNPV